MKFPSLAPEASASAISPLARVNSPWSVAERADAVLRDFALRYPAEQRTHQARGYTQLGGFSHPPDRKMARSPSAEGQVGAGDSEVGCRSSDVGCQPKTSTLTLTGKRRPEMPGGNARRKMGVGLGARVASLTSEPRWDFRGSNGVWSSWLKAASLASSVLMSAPSNWAGA